MKVTILLLAAGRSSRMNGADKLAREIDGETLLHRSTREAFKSGADVVVVTTDERMPLISDLKVTTRSGGGDMSSSLRNGLMNTDADAVIVALADMPDITASHYSALIAAYNPNTAPICRAITADGVVGHPVVFDRQFFNHLRNIKGDQGAKQVLRDNVNLITYVQTSDDGAVIDLDTEADWKKYLK